MHYALSVACAVLPSLLLVWYFYRRDLNPEPRGVLLVTFVLGILIIFPVLLLGHLMSWLLPQMIDLTFDPTFTALAIAFGLAAIPEELCKFLVVTGYCSRHREFDEPMDGLVYGATASLGFATLENILYVADYDLGTALARALTSVPCHAFLGAIMGYYVARAKFGPPAERRSSLAVGLLVPIVLHGLYDFPLILLARPGGEAALQGFSLVLAFVPFAVLIFLGALTIFLLRRLRSAQVRVKRAEPTNVRVGVWEEEV